jgi:hypothetical protein
MRGVVPARHQGRTPAMEFLQRHRLGRVGGKWEAVFREDGANDRHRFPSRGISGVQRGPRLDFSDCLG